LLIGGHQEENRRSGTENVPYIIGLGKACELAEGFVKQSRQKSGVSGTNWKRY
jgi:cysteine desulfurase